MEIISRKGAIKRGLKKYFTGKPCIHGHVAQRRVGKGVCVICSLAHSRSESARKQQKKHRGLVSTATKIKKREYFQENKEVLTKKQKNYNKSNKEKISIRQKKYTEKHKDELSEWQKAYYLKNREKIIDNMRLQANSPANYKTYSGKLIGYECSKSEDGKLMVRCKKCNSWHLPIASAVKSRINSFNGNKKFPGVECHLYCSDKCKNECDLFNSVNTPKSLRKASARSRCNQSINRKSLMELQIDKHGYNFCEKCGTKTNTLEIHHSIMVSRNHQEADNMAHQLLLCVGCHKKPEVHCRE